MFNNNYNLIIFTIDRKKGRKELYKKKLRVLVECRLHPFQEIELKKNEFVDDLHTSIDYSSCSAKDRSKFESSPAIQSILLPFEIE